MAAVGMGYEQIRGELPEGVEIACHNSKESCTLSGPSEDVAAYIEKLKARGVFARLVNVGNIAFHSKHMKPAGKLLLEMLSEVMSIGDFEIPLRAAVNFYLDLKVMENVLACPVSSYEM